MWYSENPKKSKKKPHGNTEINSSKREAILGAALSVLVNKPQECRSAAGNILASKIAKQIDIHCQTLFPEFDGEPPLSRDKISREINSWIEKLK